MFDIDKARAKGMPVASIKIMEQVNENQRKRESCKGHDFDISKFQAKYRCNNCGCEEGCEFIAGYKDGCTHSDGRVAELQAALAAYRQAEQHGTLVRLPSRSDESISTIERALHFKLYDWQKAYILGASDYVMPGRTSGKTTARILRQCLSNGKPIHLYPGHRDFEECTDEDHGSRYMDWYRHNVIDIYQKLERCGGLKLRTIYFTREAARAALEEG